MEDCGRYEICWNKFEGNFIRNMYDLCIMGDRYNPYYDGMAILGRLTDIESMLKLIIKKEELKCQKK
jgi:hypothetical protein